MAIYYKPYQYHITGASLTGNSGDADRTYTLAHSTFTGLSVFVGSQFQIPTTDYTTLSNVVTFINPIEDFMTVDLAYTVATDADYDIAFNAAYVRVWMQLDDNDYPTDSAIDTFVSIAGKKVTLDLNSGNANAILIAQLLLVRHYILHGLANRALAKGYIQINAEGRTITKPHGELLQDAKIAGEMYDKFVRENSTGTESGRTDFFDNTEYIDSETRQKVMDRMTGFQNLLDYNFGYRFSYGFRNR